MLSQVRKIEDFHPSFLDLNFANKTSKNTHCSVEFNSSKHCHTMVKGPEDEKGG